MPSEKTKKQKQRKNLHEYHSMKDIRYRGPLSYRHFKILGWLCIAMTQGRILLSVMERVSPEGTGVSPLASTLISMVSVLTVPFFLFANYSNILDTRNGYKQQFLINGTVSLVIILLTELLYHRYILGIVSLLAEDRQSVAVAMETAFSQSPLAFNFFIDLLLCTAFMFFLNYKPGRVFTGRKLIIFRCISLLPVLYEIASLLLKYLAVHGDILLSPGFSPFLTTKPPMMFLVFIILALFLKNRERRFCRNGNTHADYQKFLSTNRNSLHVSVFAAIVFLIAGVLDVILMVIIAFVQLQDPTAQLSVMSVEEIQGLLQRATSLGIGMSASLIPMAPILLLFSYTRKHKNTIIDFLIPAAGLLLIVIIYMEAAYYGASMLPSLPMSLG